MSEREQLKKAAAESGDFQLLISRAAEDPHFAIEVLRDVDNVIRTNNLAIDGESEEYKELTLRLYHARILLGKVFGDMRSQHLDVTRIPGISVGGSRVISYDRLTDPTALASQPGAEVDVAALKAQILDELRSELKRGGKS